MRRFVWILAVPVALGLGVAARAGGARGGSTPPVTFHTVTPQPEPSPFLVRSGWAGEEEPARAESGVALPVGGASPGAEGQCASGMVLVQGRYCTDVRHDCRRWLDDPKLPYARCGEYEPVARCVGARVPMRFCIDRTEHTAPGDSLPTHWSSFEKASKTCKAQGKRLCTESEWNFACEGEEMRPYPYGWERKPVCNYDREDLFVQTPKKRLLKDLRAPAGAHPECASPFGVLDMVGNLDEPVLREEARHNPPFRNALKGGWWMAARNRCRPATTAHDDHYTDIQIGVRCCSAAAGEGTPAG